jgi:hypothetical protein
MAEEAALSLRLDRYLITQNADGTISFTFGDEVKFTMDKAGCLEQIVEYKTWSIRQHATCSAEQHTTIMCILLSAQRFSVTLPNEL